MLSSVEYVVPRNQLDVVFCVCRTCHQALCCVPQITCVIQDVYLMHRYDYGCTESLQRFELLLYLKVLEEQL